MFKKPLFLETIIFLAIVWTLNFFANRYHLYWSVYDFDSLVHFFAGIAVALFFLWLYFFSDFFDSKKRNLRKFLFISIIGAMMVGFSWESYELIFKQTVASKAGYFSDTAMDLLMDLLGAIAGCFYAYIKEHNKQIIIKNNNEFNNG